MACTPRTYCRQQPNLVIRTFCCIAIAQSNCGIAEESVQYYDIVKSSEQTTSTQKVYQFSILFIVNIKNYLQFRHNRI